MNSSDLSNERYKCPENGCNASYSKPCRLEIHRRKHTGERPFVCDIEDCDKTYTNKAHLKRHKHFVHDTSSEIMCTFDGCGLVFNNKYCLRKHLNIHENTDNTFKCAYCLQAFKKKRELKRHLYSHNKEALNRCSICNISFDSFHLYSKHKRNHKTYTCDCGSVFNKWTLFCEHRKNSCSIKKIDHKCIICNKVFTTKSNLKIHSLTHLEESQTDIYRCPYLNCKRGYKYKKNLNAHIAFFHEKKNDDIKINCTEEGCDMVFKSKKNLKQHILNIHKGVPKKNKDRRPRKDKGKKRKCMASVLSGVPLHVREHLAIIKNSNFACNGNEKLPNEISKRTDEKQLPVVNDKEIMPPTSNIVDKGTEKEPNNPLNITEQIHNKDLKQKFVRIWQNTTNLGEILILEDTRHYL